MTIFDFDEEYRKSGIHVLAGTDEAGRGPLAGPVFAAAVILPEGIVIEGLNDSKKLSPKKRDALYPEIKAKALCWAVEKSDVERIERDNILNASMAAMAAAVAALEIAPELLLVDGNIVRGFSHRAIALKGGDGKSACIAAASVLAKVERDRYMCALDGLYPEYGFSQHKGYGTPRHIAALREFGPCPEHRMSFLKGIL